MPTLRTLARPWMSRGLPLPCLLLLVALNACATSSPPPELPAEPPASWTAGPPPGETAAEGTVPDHWWTTLGDPRLDELVSEALERNHDLAAAAARIDAAAAQARIAGADLRPQASAGLSASRARQNFIGFPIPGSDRSVLSTTSTSLGVSLDLSWEADLWGRIRAGRDASVADLAASRADYAGARLSLAGQTAKGWFALREAAAQLELAARTADNRRRNAERVRRRYESGLRPALDLRLALASLADAEARTALRRRQLDSARRQLEILVGRYPDATLGSEEDAAFATLPPPGRTPPLGLPSELLLRRPDLAAAERRLAAAGARVAEARALLYPRIALTGSTGRRSRELEDLVDADFSVWSLAGSLLQPIFQGGRLRAGVELSEARFREVSETYLQSVLRAFAEVEAALAAEELLDERIAALEASTRQAKAAQELAEDRYASGLVDYLSVLQSQRDALAAEGQLLEARRERLAVRVDLHLALGGGFTAPPVRVSADADPKPATANAIFSPGK